MQEIVVDKSFIDGSSVSGVNDLCGRYQVLMTQELFFELITTENEKRQHAFRKFPDSTNPVTLIPNVGTLLRYETKTRKPCVPIHQHTIKEPFQFNPTLRDGTFVFRDSNENQLANLRQEVESDTHNFIKRCLVVDGFFPELKGQRVSDWPTAIVQARHSIATDINRVREVYQKITANHPEGQPPNPEIIDNRWAWFRWVQVQLVAALRIFVRYQGKMPSSPSPKFWTDAEHTMLDSYYVLFGTLCGALASRDREIQEDFKLLSPDGLLLK